MAIGAALMLGTACSFDKSVSTSGRLTCQRDGDCPSGLRCQSGLALCVNSALLDETAPTLLTANLTISPRAGNPVVAPSTLGPRSIAHLRLTMSEVLAEPPEVSPTALDGTAVALGCTVTAVADTIYDVDCSTADGARSGVVTINLVLVDLARNTTQVAQPPQLSVDVDSPVAPSEGRMSIRSAPWGDALGNAPSLVLENDGGVTDAQYVRARLSAGLVTPLAAVGAQGDFEPLVLPVVNDAVELQAIDSAGNESPWVAVKSLEWVASFGGKRAGSQFENPHRFQVVRAAADGLEGFPSTERGADDGITVRGGASVTAAGAGTWRRRNVTLAPDGTEYPAAVWDPLRSRIVRFGGARGGKPGGALWEWLGHDWLDPEIIDPEGDGAPTARLAPQTTWDWQRRAVVMMGGSQVDVLNDTWSWNGSSWARLPDATVRRLGGAMVPDPVGGGLLAFGGLGADGGTEVSAERLSPSGVWSNVDATGFPPARALGAIATDPNTGVSWLFGGAASASADSALGDLWQFAGGKWTLLASAGPPPRTASALAWDSRRKRLVLYGGTNRTGNDLSDTWEWTGTAWQQRLVLGAPGVRAQHQLVFDEARNKAVLFGGRSSAANSDETWVWDGTAWARENRIAPGPEKLVSSNMISVGDTLVTVAANAALSSLSIATLDETAGWSPASIEVGSASLGAWLACDSNGQQTSLVGPLGGGAAQLWAVGQDGGWSQQSANIGVVGDRVKGLYFGGGELRAIVDNAAVGRFVGGALANPIVFSPPFNQQVSAALPDGGALVVGIANAASAAAFVSASWVTAGPALPAVFAPFALVYDVARMTPLVVSGGTYPALVGANTVFELAHGAWSVVPIADPEGDGAPLVNLPPLVAHRSIAQVTSLIERGPGADVGRLWELDIARQRPQVEVRFSIGQLPAGANITALTFEVVAGASGAGPDGFTVFERDSGGWVSTGLSGTAAADAPQRLVFSTTDPKLIARLAGGSGEVAFALRPLAANGLGLSRITVDAPQLTLTLRLR